MGRFDHAASREGTPPLRECAVDRMSRHHVNAHEWDTSAGRGADDDAISTSTLLELVAQAGRHEAKGYLDNAQKLLYIIGRSIDDDALARDVSRVSEQLKLARDAMDKIKVGSLLGTRICAPTSLEIIVADVLNQTRGTLEAKGIDVVVSAHAPDVVVVVEPVRLALLHLIQNTISAFSRPESPQRNRQLTIEIAAESRKTVRLTFSDNAGLDPAVLMMPEELGSMSWREAIFERGVSSGHGAGFGLFLARKLLHDAGGCCPGTIELVGHQGGATFAIRLPADLET